MRYMAIADFQGVVVFVALPHECEALLLCGKSAGCRVAENQVAPCHDAQGLLGGNGQVLLAHKNHAGSFDSDLLHLAAKRIA